MGLDFGTGRHLSAAADKRRAVERRAAVDRMKDKPCADCKRAFPFFVMDFDHIDPANKAFTISQVVTRASWADLVAEIEKCDVVCACCHRLRSWTPSCRPLNGRQQLIIEIKAGPCADCGGNFRACQMDFDHVRGEKIGQVPKMGSLRAIREEADKCDIVCANCHRLRSQETAKGTPRIQPEDVDMVWKQVSKVNPQTLVQRASRSWHSLAGTTTDGALAARHGLTRGAIRKYRKKMNIPPFTPQGVRPDSREVQHVA